MYLIATGTPRIFRPSDGPGHYLGSNRSNLGYSFYVYSFLFLEWKKLFFLYKILAQDTLLISNRTFKATWAILSMFIYYLFRKEKNQAILPLQNSPGYFTRFRLYL